MTWPARSRILTSVLESSGGSVANNASHPSEATLERYAMGILQSETELAPLEEHLLACPACVARSERMEDYVWSIRSALGQSWIQVIESGG